MAKKPKLFLTPEQTKEIKDLMLHLGTQATIAGTRSWILNKLGLDVSASKVHALRKELGLTCPIRKRTTEFTEQDYNRKKEFDAMGTAGINWGWLDCWSRDS